jgi:predicted nucleic acid-binding protein
MPRNHIRKAGQETPVSDDTNVSLHRADCDDLKARKQEAIVMKNEIKETKAVINAKALEEEIHRLQMENERLERLLKVLIFYLPYFSSC